MMNMKNKSFPIDKNRGSALVAAVIFALLAGALVGSFLKLSTNEYRSASSAFYYNSLLNLAEAGAEEAAWRLNNDDWDTWDEKNALHQVKQYTDLNIGPYVAGDISVLAINYDSDTPTLIVEGKTQLPSSRSILKQIEIELSKRSLFANGLTAKDTLTFSGGVAKVDSYDSGDGDYDSFFNRNDNGSIASMSVIIDAVDVANAEIYGYVATGGADPSVGPNGKIYGADTPEETDVDLNRISTDFYAEFKDVDAPTLVSPDTAMEISGTLTIGDPSGFNEEHFHLDSLDIASNETLIIDGPVIIVVDDFVDINGDIQVTANGSVTFYVEGDFDIDGNGTVNNTNSPSSFVLYGTNDTPGDQEFNLHGNGALRGAVYAPNADLSLSGGGSSGEFLGAAVSYQISINGNYDFHYDEQLEDFFGSDPSYKMTAWRELTDNADRIPFDDIDNYLDTL